MTTNGSVIKKLATSHLRLTIFDRSYIRLYFNR